MFSIRPPPLSSRPPPQSNAGPSVYFGRPWSVCFLRRTAPELTANPGDMAGAAALELATGPPTADSEREPTEVDSFRQAQEADLEHRKAKIKHSNRSRKRRKPTRSEIHPWTSGQVPQTQQNGQHASISQ